MVKIKLVAALVLILLVVALVLQNTGPVETRFLLMTFTWPLAALLGLTLLAGVGVGILMALGLSGGKSKKSG